MEVVVMRQRISRHVDAGFVTLQSRVAVVTNRLNLFIHPAKPNTQLTLRQIINGQEVC